MNRWRNGFDVAINGLRGGGGGGGGEREGGMGEACLHGPLFS